MRPFSTNNRSISYLIVILVLGLSSCKKNKDPDEVIGISAIKIEAQKNKDVVANDLEGMITGDKISFKIPANVTLKDVLLTCTFTGEGVYINNVKVDNAASKTELTNGTVIEVKSKKGDSLQYTVVFSESDDQESNLISFVLEKKHNPQLNADIAFEINGNTIVGNLKKHFFNVVPTFTTNSARIEVNGKAQTSSMSAVDLKQPVVYYLTTTKGFKKQYNVKINWNDALPQINVTTNGGAAITSTDVYVPGNVAIDGQSVYGNYAGTTRIRGRGNTTWTFPKKPYRLKLDTKASLFGLPAAKDWVLLANYLDGMHTLNAVAMKAGKLLNMPYTNNIIPVELTLNNQYLGAYMLTEQVEVGTTRVNVGTNGTLLELDINYDDTYKFRSAAYNLPVQIKFPDLTNQAEILPIKAQFDKLEALVSSTNFPNNNYLDYISDESIVNYFIVYMLTDNEEINHPKSVFIHKTKTGKYALGPIWDFDWAYGYEKSQIHFFSYNRPLFWTPSSTGTRFFSKFLADPKIKSLLKQRWSEFKANKMEELLSFVDDYTFVIEGARERDYQKWKRGNTNFKNDTKALKSWLQNRSTYLDTYIGSL